MNDAVAESAYLEYLNAAQRAAVTHEAAAPDGGAGTPLLVIAGAGSGKTQTLAHRAAHLLLSGVDARRVLLLTFSRRAANEMARRANGICETARGHRARFPWAGTFHAIGARLLREQARGLGLSPYFSVLDRSDAADLLDVCRQELGLARGRTRFPRKDTCLGIYSQTINRQCALTTVLAQRYPWCQDHHDDLKRLFAAYTQRKQALSLLDYDDLLLYWALMLGDDRLAAATAARFDHILVDEYQDTNVLQADIVARLAPDGRGLCVVGDDAQAIYGFRAASVDNILGFGQRYPRTRMVTLEHNYRSTQALLDASNALMGQAARRYDKRLISTRGAGIRPRHVLVADGWQQARYVVAQVLATRETGVALNQQAVLFRNAHHANELELALIQRDIPFRKYGGLKFLEAAHIKDLLALMRWADNPHNQIAAYRALQLVPGVGPAGARKAFAYLHEHDGVFDCLAGWWPARADDGIWQALIATLVGLADPACPWPGGLEGPARWYQSRLPDRFDAPITARASDIDDLVRIAAAYPDRTRFLTELTLDPPAATGDHGDDAKVDEDYLVLSTVHSAKGREFDSVYLLNVADGAFPSEYATGNDAALEEERRLLYVAMTRAKNHLEAISPQRYYATEQPSHGDRHVYAAASRFFTPAVARCFDAVTAGVHAEQATAHGAGQPVAEPINLNAAVRRLWD